jgi:hypothetical protein
MRATRRVWDENYTARAFLAATGKDPHPHPASLRSASEQSSRNVAIEQSQLLCYLAELTFAFNSVMPSSSKPTDEKEKISIPIEDLSPIAQPVAQDKLLKRIHKTVKKGTHNNGSEEWGYRFCLTASKARQLRRGVKEVVKTIRKGEKGWAD